METGKKRGDNVILVGSNLWKLEECAKKINRAFDEIRDIKAAVDRAGGQISSVDIELMLYHVERLKKVIDEAANEVLALMNLLYSREG